MTNLLSTIEAPLDTPVSTISKARVGRSLVTLYKGSVGTCIGSFVDWAAIVSDEEVSTAGSSLDTGRAIRWSSIGKGRLNC